MIKKPHTSICLITYNQEVYIKQTIESILMQTTSFSIELIISNDCSTDGTHEIIQSVIDTHAKGHLITYFNQEHNLGMMPNFIFALEKCHGTYIAICEGDDNWTDPLKLEKQVAFLENNPEYGICFHNTEQQNLLTQTAHTGIPGVIKDTDYTIQDYILANRTATCSIVYKRALFDKVPDWFVTVPFGDLALILSVLYNSKNKKGRILKDTMAVYRIHHAGVHGSLHTNNKSLILAYKQHIEFTKIIEKELLIESIYKVTLRNKKINTYAILASLAKRGQDILAYAKYKLYEYFNRISLKLHL
ncbi:glycosyltransferase [Xanthomarina sp. F2636L]|uniref:glycosyltransferase n=1 Tax=Xanthomarina sp. F2636L TaxID=2996018 RepID=UPI00225DD0C6|nr:glycosyltransferase [Xanthomarina sp. F2636L]MCX7549360.1 glycosyltransferase [Xanthomarina sp. F2636L]